MLFPALYKIIVKKVTFVGFRRRQSPQSPPWIHPWQETCRLNLKKLEILENVLALPTNMQLTCSAEQLNTSRACQRNILCNETALWGKDQEVKGLATFNDSTVDQAHLCPWEWRKFIPLSAARGNDSPGAESLWGPRITAESAESPNNVTRTAFITVHLPPKNLVCDHGGGKLASCPWWHLTSLRPSLFWSVPYFKHKDMVCLYMCVQKERKSTFLTAFEQREIEARNLFAAQYWCRRYGICIKLQRQWYQICVCTCSGKLFKIRMNNMLLANISLSQTLSVRKTVPNILFEISRFRIV